MKRLTLIIILATLFSCTILSPEKRSAEEYSRTAISLSDFSMKIIAHYKSKNLPIPNNFDTSQFFALLKNIYPDQSRVNFVKNKYTVFVRPLDTDQYSVMLCDPKTNKKIMEDLSCHVNRVEIQLWDSNKDNQCKFESDWKSFCN